MFIRRVYSWRYWITCTGAVFVAGTAYMMRMPLFILIVGFIYLAEVISVILQVTYFKKTGGKRLFKMAPIHHQLELCDGLRREL